MTGAERAPQFCACDKCRDCVAATGYEAAQDECERQRARADLYERALREIVNTLGPDSITFVASGPQGLICEAGEALRVAKAALVRLDGNETKPCAA